jgi:reelin
MNLPSNGFVQFEINLGCGSTNPTFVVNLEYSTDYGSTWSTLVPFCNPVSSSCSSVYSLGLSRYSYVDVAGEWRRFIIPVSITGTARFRWRNERVAGVSGSVYQAEWGITNVYVGSQCARGCGGFGTCINGTCQCDAGFALNATSGRCFSTTAQPTEIRESFEGSTSNWLLLNGVSFINSSCGVLSSGRSLYAFGSSQRRAITVDMNCVQASVLNAVIQLGTYYGSTATCSYPSQSSETIYLGYSVDGGVSFNQLGVVPHGSSSQPTDYTFALPAAAKTTSTRFMFWQPQSSGPNIDQWV